LKTKVNLELSAKDAFRGVERGDILIAIDVLRCTSTIIAALANGAREVIPIGTLKEALEFRRRHPAHILAGERGGVKPKGFDLGNSPLGFSSDKVAGKHIIITTTSGTKALTRMKGARWVLIGTLLNAKVVAQESLKIARVEGVGISLILAGRKGRFSLEDFICSGAIATNLRSETISFSDAVHAASLSFEMVNDHLYQTISKGEHAQNLIRLGFDEDVKFCCQIDKYSSVIPILRNGTITLLR